MPSRGGPNGYPPRGDSDLPRRNGPGYRPDAEYRPGPERGYGPGEWPEPARYPRRPGPGAGGYRQEAGFG
ncbi:MAG TPA: hypothetical protein VF843_15195, partial [Streptosporangiaceae bacterium]